MKKLIFTFIIASIFNCLCFGQIKNDTIETTSDSIKVYVDKKEKIYLDNEKISLIKLRVYLQKMEYKNAKFGTVFPTPLKVFVTVEKVNNLFENYDIKAVWYKDPEFKTPAWE